MEKCYYCKRRVKDVKDDCITPGVSFYKCNTFHSKCLVKFKFEEKDKITEIKRKEGNYKRMPYLKRVNELKNKFIKSRKRNNQKMKETALELFKIMKKNRKVYVMKDLAYDLEISTKELMILINDE